MATKTSQNEKILNFLRSGKQLTVAEARNRFGVQRLSARIGELRDEGFIIYTNKKRVTGGVNHGKVITRYRLDNSQQG